MLKSKKDKEKKEKQNEKKSTINKPVNMDKFKNLKY